MLALLIGAPSKVIYLGITRFLYTHIYVNIKNLLLVSELKEILRHF